MKRRVFIAGIGVVYLFGLGLDIHTARYVCITFVCLIAASVRHVTPLLTRWGVPCSPTSRQGARWEIQLEEAAAIAIKLSALASQDNAN